MTEKTTARIASLRQKMADNAVDLTVIGPTGHLRWLVGVNPHGDERPVMLFVSQTYAGFLIPGLNAASVRRHTDLPFHTWSDDEGPARAMAELIARTGINPANVSLSLDKSMRADFALRVLDALPAARRSFSETTVSALRCEKDESAYRALKASALLNDRAVAAGFAALREGISETEIAAVITAEYEKAGATAEFTSICFGGNGAFCHHHTGATKLVRNSAVLIDAGARHLGYPSDMTRIGWFGDSPSAEFLKVAAVVEAAVQAALAAARPGAPARAVDQAARGTITAAGYGERFLHRTGHGLGLEIHEEPYITGASERPLGVGNVFSIEPGIYLEGSFGVRLEDIVFLRSDGPEVLSEMPRTPVMCG